MAFLLFYADYNDFGQSENEMEKYVVQIFVEMLQKHGIRTKLFVEEAQILFDRSVFLEFIRYAMGSGPELLTSKC